MYTELGDVKAAYSGYSEKYNPASLNKRRIKAFRILNDNTAKRNVREKIPKRNLIIE